jgi:N-acyl-D-aspartate/D-glutamate deacylase
VIPRPTGFLFGLELSYHPFALNPSYRAIADLPLAEKVARMRDPAFRRQLLSEAPEDSNQILVRTVCGPQLLFRLGDVPNYIPRYEDSLAARAKAKGQDERELIYDELLRDEGHAILLAPKGNVVGTDLGVAREVLRHDNALIGLADGGAHYGMICDGGLPTWFLTACVRDAPADLAFALPFAIRALSRKTAEAVGLEDRGLIAPGYKADVNVIDFASLTLQRPEIRHDLPAGGRRVHQGARGYVATIVSGTVVSRNGATTGALPGRLVRGARQPREAADQGIRL